MRFASGGVRFIMMLNGFGLQSGDIVGISFFVFGSFCPVFYSKNGVQCAHNLTIF
jgi:hypothetical protein